MNTQPITDRIVTSYRPTRNDSTYLNSRVAFDVRNTWAQSQRPGSTWTFVVTIGSRVVASVGGFATHGQAVAAMYRARPDDFTSVTSINADSTSWDVYESTPARPGYGKGRTGPVVGSARVVLTDPSDTYTVEFIDQDGDTCAVNQPALSGDDAIAIVDRAYGHLSADGVYVVFRGGVS